MNNSIIDNNNSKDKRPFESIGQLIRNQREGLGISKAELCCRIDCGLSTLDHWESGSKLPQDSNVQALAQVFGISPENLLMGMSCLTTSELETPEQAEITNDLLTEIVANPETTEIPKMTGSGLATFSLAFQNNKVVNLRIVKFDHVIDLSLDEIPEQIIDVLRAKQ